MKSTYFLFPFLFTGLVACGGGDNNKAGSNTQTNPYQGVWTSTVNGESFDITNNKVRIYQHNSRFCLIADEFDNIDSTELSSTFDLTENNQNLSVQGSDGTAELHAPIVYYSKTDALPDVCDDPIATIDEDGYQRDPARDLDLFGQTFSDYYLSFDLKQLDWDTRYQDTLTLVDNNTTDAELMELLYQLTAPLADAHVQVHSEQLGSFSVDGKPTLIARLINEYAEQNALSEPLSQMDIDGLNIYVEEQLTLQNDIVYSYADDNTIKTAANDELMWFSVDNISYLFIGSMTGFANQDDANLELNALDTALDQVLTDIQDSEGLIIDVRSNNGGNDFLSMAIASRFVSGERLAFSKQSRDGNHRSELEEVYIDARGDTQYLGPIALLTSNTTVSAAEVFTLIMRSLPNVTLIGETTQGALSDALDKKLPNGFEFSLSNQFYFSTEGEWFEHTGIPVDIEVPFFSQEERNAEVDLGLETAYALLIDEN